jgi:hypothetical protein
VLRAVHQLHVEGVRADVGDPVGVQRLRLPAVRLPDVHGVVADRAGARAPAWGWWPSWLIARSTRARVGSEIARLPLSTQLTVLGETPAALTTSASVTMPVVPSPVLSLT